MNPKPLTPTELAAWQTLLGVIMRFPIVLDAHLKQQHIRNAEFQVLWCLSFRDDGTKTMGDLAATASVTPSHLSRVAARLEDQGWITRRTDPRDARSTLASLTEAGRQKVAECLPGYYDVLRQRLFGLLSEDQINHLSQITAEIMTSLVAKPGRVP